MRPFEQTSQLPEFLGELSYAGYRDIGCRCVLCVEGPTDVKTVQQILRVFGKNMAVAILQLGGSSMINAVREHELAELQRICDRVAVIIDSERTTAGAALSQDRGAFVTICEKLKFTVKVLERRAIENYFTDVAVKAVKGPKYTSLGPHESLGSKQLAWDKTENWRIAAGMSKSDWANTDIAAFVESLP